MVNLMVMFIAGMVVGHGDLMKDDVGYGMGGFSVDQRGKLVFFKSGAWPDKVGFLEAYEALVPFLDSKGNKTERGSSGRMESNGRTPFRKHAGIGNHVAGDLNYTLVVEENGAGFNYWFTDLTYQPYSNDRYGKRVKATSSPIPLERKMSSINEHIWQKQRIYAYETIEELANQLLVRLEAAGMPDVVDTSIQ